MNDAAIELVRMIVELEQCKYVRSLFQVTVECGMDYSFGWRVLNHAEALGYVTVKRNGGGRPLDIASTEQGRLVATLRPAPKWVEAVI